MFVTKKICLILFNLYFVLVCNAEVDYFQSANWLENESVDPHSFNYNKHTKTESLPPEDNVNHEIAVAVDSKTSGCYRLLQKCRESSNTDVADELLSRRLINILISRTKFKEDGLLFIGNVNLEATPKELEALKNFGIGKLTLREVDPILNKVIQVPPFDAIYESKIWIQTAALFLWDLLIQHKEYVIGALFILFLYYTIRRTHFTFGIILIISLNLVLVVSFFITWWKLILDARSKHAALQMKHLNMPVQCRPNQMSWLDIIKSWFDHDDVCEKYFEAMMHDPVLQVTPVEALTYMLTHIILSPMANSGHIFSRFVEALTEHMPFYVKWPLQVTIYLGIFPALMLFVVLLLGGTLSLGPFSMISLYGPRTSKPRHSNCLESKNERQPIEIILNVNTNVPPAATIAQAEPNNLAIKSCSNCEQDKKKEKSVQEPATHDEKASGDSKSTKESLSLKESDDAKGEAGVRERKVVELGSGDHNFIIK